MFVLFYSLFFISTSAKVRIQWDAVPFSFGFSFIIKSLIDIQDLVTVKMLLGDT